MHKLIERGKMKVKTQFQICTPVFIDFTVTVDCARHYTMSTTKLYGCYKNHDCVMIVVLEQEFIKPEEPAREYVTSVNIQITVERYFTNFSNPKYGIWDQVVLLSREP